MSRLKRSTAAKFVAAGAVLLFLVVGQSLATEDKKAKTVKGRVDDLESLVEELEGRIEALEETPSDIVAIWSGGSSTDGVAPGWNKYRTDKEDFNSASAHLDVDPDGTITVLKDGFYRINFWTISLVNISGPSGSVGVKVLRNGLSIHHQGYGASGWVLQSADVTWLLEAGDEIEVLVKAGSLAYYNWGPDGPSRLQIQYLGQLDGN